MNFQRGTKNFIITNSHIGRDFYKNGSQAKNCLVKVDYV